MAIHHILLDGLIKMDKLIGLSYILKQNQELKISHGINQSKNSMIQIMPQEIYSNIFNQERLLNGTYIFKLFHKWMATNIDGTYLMSQKLFLMETIL